MELAQGFDADALCPRSSWRIASTQQTKERFVGTVVASEFVS